MYNNSFINNQVYGSGGAVDSNNPANITNCFFWKNQAVSSYGGALRQRSGSINLVNCIFRENSGASGGAVWGDITNTASFSATGSVFVSNSATSDSGGWFSYGPTTFQNCNFTSNTAGRNTGAAQVSNGVISDSVFFGNSAPRVGATTGNVGALRSNGGLTLSNSSFINNYASNADGAIISTGLIIIRDSSFINNTGTYSTVLEATSTSGVTISNSIFTDNFITNNGQGHINVGGPYVDIRNCTFLRNSGKVNNVNVLSTTSTGNTYIYNNTFMNNNADYGGAISVQGPGSTGITNIYNNVFINNNVAAIGSNGGAIYINAWRCLVPLLKWQVVQSM
jgi:hypothetical protein